MPLVSSGAENRAKLPGQPAVSRNIAVLYPDLAEPYRSIFAQVVEGIEAQTGRRAAQYAVGNSNSMAIPDILAEMKQQEVKVVVALGRQGVITASALPRELFVIAGCVISAPEIEGRKFPVVSMAPDPVMVFERLKLFMPNARRVVVVYDPRQNEWLIRLARDAARKHGLALLAVEATSLKNAGLAYQDLLSRIDPEKDALWLPLDSTTVEESTVLPFVLEKAWSRSLTVFSNNVMHAKRGVLFAVYPDSFALGRQLANLVLNSAADGSMVSSTVPLKESLLAVNVRVAQHLGLRLSPSQQHFNRVFPDY